jgi:hypothetical protein
VFRAMLAPNMLEGRTGRIDLPDVEQETFQDLIFYLTNNYMRKDSDLMGLLDLSDKYDIQVFCTGIYFVDEI